MKIINIIFIGLYITHGRNQKSIVIMVKSLRNTLSFHHTEEYKYRSIGVKINIARC